MSSLSSDVAPAVPVSLSHPSGTMEPSPEAPSIGEHTQPVTELSAPLHRPKPATTRSRQASARDAEWQQATAKLSEVLGCLEEGHFLILQTRDESPYYVQFAAEGPAGIRVEAVSNRFLEDWQSLDRIAQSRLRRLGWRPPTDIGDGPVNWWRSFPQGATTDAIAELALSTLRKVYEVSRPVALVYRAFARSGAEILLPTLGMARDGKATLERRAEAALRGLLELDELVRDDDGDWPIRSDDVMVYVRAGADTGYVTVFSPALLGVTPTPGLLEAVNQFNSRIRVARAFVTDHEVVISAEVDDQPNVEDGVMHAFKAVSSLANVCAAELQPGFGGFTRFGAPDAPAPDPVAEPGYGLYL